MPDAGQDDRDRVLAAILGKRGEKHVDRVVFAPPAGCAQAQPPRRSVGTASDDST